MGVGTASGIWLHAIEGGRKELSSAWEGAFSGRAGTEEMALRPDGYAIRGVYGPQNAGEL